MLCHEGSTHAVQPGIAAEFGSMRNRLDCSATRVNLGSCQWPVLTRSMTFNGSTF